MRIERSNFRHIAVYFVQNIKVHARVDYMYFAILWLGAAGGLVQRPVGSFIFASAIAHVPLLQFVLQHVMLRFWAQGTQK